MKTVYKELLSFYIAMVVATWRFINFLYPSLHDNDDDDDLLAASLSITHNDYSAMREMRDKWR